MEVPSFDRQTAQPQEEAITGAQLKGTNIEKFMAESGTEHTLQDVARILEGLRNDLVSYGLSPEDAETEVWQKLHGLVRQEVGPEKMRALDLEATERVRRLEGAAVLDAFDKASNSDDRQGL